MKTTSYWYLHTMATILVAPIFPWVNSYSDISILSTRHRKGPSSLIAFRLHCGVFFFFSFLDSFTSSCSSEQYWVCVPSIFFINFWLQWLCSYHSTYKLATCYCTCFCLIISVMPQSIHFFFHFLPKLCVFNFGCLLRPFSTIG